MRFVGDRVAFVVAETQAQARDAAEMIEIDYEPLPAVALIGDAAKDGAPKVWDDNPNGNVAFMLMFGSKEATDAAFAKAKHVVKLEMENNRLTRCRWSRAPRSATTTRRKTTTRSIRRRRTRTARASRSRTSSMWPRTRCAWSRPTSAAASG